MTTPRPKPGVALPPPRISRKNVRANLRGGWTGELPKTLPQKMVAIPPRTVTPVVHPQIYAGMTPKAQAGVTVGKVPFIQRNTPAVPPRVYKQMKPMQQQGVTIQPPTGMTGFGGQPLINDALKQPFPKGPGGIQRKPRGKKTTGTMFGM